MVQEGDAWVEGPEVGQKPWKRLLHGRDIGTHLDIVSALPVRILIG
jgi:hypothetical protein